MTQHTKTTSCKCGECTAKVQESIELLEDRLHGYEDDIKTSEKQLKNPPIWDHKPEKIKQFEGYIKYSKEQADRYTQAIDLLRSLL